MIGRNHLRGVIFAGIGTALLTLSFVPSTPAQEEKPKSMRIQAVAQGSGTQLGRITNVDITIREFSTPEELAALVDAFKAKGSAGLARALGKMSSKGRIAITGTLGYDINYVRLIETPTGKSIRFVTDRPISVREAWTDSRSQDYNLSAGEVQISGEKGKGSGVLYPACQFTVDKEGHVTLELRRNEWKLNNVSVHE